jgi:hypothetical protein
MMQSDRVVRDVSLIPCEQCHNAPGTEPHACTNPALREDPEELICNCCETCQELCRQAVTMPH